MSVCVCGVVIDSSSERLMMIEEIGRGPLETVHSRPSQ